MKRDLKGKHFQNVEVREKPSATESLGMHEMKQHKPWFDEECLGILDQRKQAKMQWIQGPSQSNVDTLNKVRRDASRHFRNKNLKNEEAMTRVGLQCH